MRLNGIVCWLLKMNRIRVMLLKHILRSAGFNVMGAMTGTRR